MIFKDIKKVDEASLKALIGVASEGRMLDFKQSLYRPLPEDDNEFLADVISFANAGGGTIIFGIREEGGVAVELLGVDSVNSDALKQRWESLIRDRIEPRLPSHHIQVILLSSGRSIALLQIDRSWIGPHALKISKGTYRIFSRSSSGKYPLDSFEIRQAFLASESLAERIQSFRRDRIVRLLANDGAVSLRDGAVVLIHILPLSAFGEKREIDLGKTRRDQQILMPPSGGFSYERFTLEGRLFGDLVSSNAKVNDGYAQVYRTGIVEGAYSIPPRKLENHDDSGCYLSGPAFEDKLRKFASNAGRFLASTQLSGPGYVGVALLNIENFFFFINSWDTTGTFGRPLADLGEQYVDQIEAISPSDLESIIDRAWNAVDYEESPLKPPKP